MFNVSSQIYNLVAEEILDRLGSSDYISERIEFNADGVECLMLFSAIAYRTTRQYPEGEVVVLDDLVPVWWEFHTSDERGEVMNDFSFNELRQYFN